MTLKEKASKHLAETGMTRFQHTRHVLEMMFYSLMAFFTAIPHAIHPGFLPGTARRWMFDKALTEQMHTRPNILMDIQKKFNEDRDNFNQTYGTHKR